MSKRRRRNRPFGRAWREAELDDEGDPLVDDVQPVRCPTCNRSLDLGGLDDVDVHRCAFCRSRTRWLWSDRRSRPVDEIRGPNPDWWVENWDDLWRGYDVDDDYDEGNEMGADFPCPNGCEDPVFGGYAPAVQAQGRWVCAVCGAGEEGEQGDWEE